MRLELHLDQLSEKLEQFRKQREQLRQEQAELNLGNRRIVAIDATPYNKALLWLIIAILVTAPVITWLLYKAGPVAVQTTPASSSSGPSGGAASAAKDAGADRLHDQKARVTQNSDAAPVPVTAAVESVEQASGNPTPRSANLTSGTATANNLNVDVLSRRVAADELNGRIDDLMENLETTEVVVGALEARILKLTGDVEKLAGLSAHLGSTQQAADNLERRLAGLIKDVKTLNSLTADLEAKQKAIDALKAQDEEGASLWAILVRETAAAGSPQETTNASSSSGKPLPGRSEEPVNAALTENATMNPSKEPMWRINLISSSDKSDALRFSNAAQAKGIPTEIQEVFVNSTSYWRVQITGFSTRDEAKNYSNTVKSTLGLKEIWVMQH